MSGVLACPHCGAAIVVSADAPGQQPRGHQPRGQQRQGQQRQPQGQQRPVCEICGGPVNERRDGSWFRTCIRCG